MYLCALFLGGKKIITIFKTSYCSYNNKIHQLEVSNK